MREVKAIPPRVRKKPGFTESPVHYQDKDGFGACSHSFADRRKCSEEGLTKDWLEVTCFKCHETKLRTRRVVLQA